MKLKVFLNSYGVRREGGLNGEHTAMVSGKGRDITAADLIATAATRGVPENKARAMFFLMLKKDFKNFFELFCRINLQFREMVVY